MAVRKYIVQVDGSIVAKSAPPVRLAGDEETPTASPALELQQSLDARIDRAAESQLAEPVVRKYPGAARIGIMVGASVILWAAIFGAVWLSIY